MVIRKVHLLSGAVVHINCHQLSYSASEALLVLHVVALEERDAETGAVTLYCDVCGARWSETDCGTEREVQLLTKGKMFNAGALKVQPVARQETEDQD